MTKRAESKYKINRRLGVNLWGRPKSPINKREYGPGQHGQRRKKATDFGTQLMAKQKLRGYYGNISEKQFRRYYQEAVRVRGDSSQLLIELLERRLDAVVYRMKFAITPFAARQFISHGHDRGEGAVEAACDGARRVTEHRAGCARVPRGRSPGDEGPVRAGAEADRCAVPGADGA
jgi:ribosomal protein S4